MSRSNGLTVNCAVPARVGLGRDEGQGRVGLGRDEGLRRVRGEGCGGMRGGEEWVWGEG